MKETIEEQLKRIWMIDNNYDRVEYAVKKFNEKELSAKVIRELYKTLDTGFKMMLINLLYSKENRKENMERLPPKILMPERILLEDDNDISLYSTILKYDLIQKFENSKVQDRFTRFKKVLYKAGDIPLKATTNNDLRKIISNSTLTESKAVKGFIDEITSGKNKKNIKPLGLPSAMTIGIELEFVGVNYKDLKKLDLYLKQKYGLSYFNDFKIKHDSSVKENGTFKEGTEIVSAVLDDTEESWEKLRDICEFIQAIGGRVNKSCGGHIHIGANIIGVDKEAWKTLLDVWKEAEPLIYMMSNKRGEITREGAILHYAKMNTDKIEKIDWNSISIRNDEDIKKIAQKTHENASDRYRALNLTNLITQKHNTIEFRLSNGTIDYDILRENILLYGRLVQMAKMHSIDPNWKRKELELFKEHDILEQEKVERFLNLVFDEEEEKKIFYDRWESKVGEIPIFGENSVKTYVWQKVKKNNNNCISKNNQNSDLNDEFEI